MQITARMPKKKFQFYRTIIGLILFTIFGQMLFYYENLFLENNYFIVVIVAGLIASAFFSSGLYRKPASMLLLVVLALITNHNESILRVIPGYLGFFLIFTLFAPSNEGILFKDEGQNDDWKIPPAIEASFFLVLILSITFSGVVKLLNIEWQSGEALMLLQDNPRINTNFLGYFNIPEIVLRLINYLVIAVECSFLPFYLYKKTRLLAFSCLLILFVTMLIFMNIPLLIGTMIVFISMTEDGYCKKWYT